MVNYNKNYKYTKNKAAINIILILVITKLILLTILTMLDQIYIYKKILNNEKQAYYWDENLKLKLLDLAKQTQDYKFLPDDLSVDCKSGINVYKIHLDRNVCAYVGVRANMAPNNYLTQSNNRLDVNAIIQKFKDNFTQPNIIDYIIGSNCIYLRCRDLKTNQDLINIITLDRNNNILIDPIISVPAALKFFLRANNLIFLYAGLEPQIYRLNYHKKLFAKKITLNFNFYESEPPPNNANVCDLFWDQNKHLHIASIASYGYNSRSYKLNTYEFMLPEDNIILSIRTNNY